MSENPQVNIITVCYNNLEYTTKCLESILVYTDIPYELIVVDNGSDDGTREYLQGAKKALINIPNLVSFNVITLDKNYRLCRGINEGFKAATAPYIMMVDNDIILAKGTVSGLLERLKAHPEYGAVSPNWCLKDINNSWHNFFPDTTSIYTKMDEFLETYTIPMKEGHISDWMFGSCFMTTREVWNEVGEWDEAYQIGCMDNDWAWRLMWTGKYYPMVFTDLPCYHEGEVTRKGLNPDYVILEVKDCEYFEKKYGMSAHDVSKLCPKRDEMRVKVSGKEIKKEEYKPYTLKINTPKPKTLVGTLALDNLVLTDLFLESLYRSVEVGKDVDVLLIDQNSTEDIASLQWKYPMLNYIRNDKNVGVASGWNQIIKFGDYDYYAIMNNDIVLFVYWWHSMIEQFKNNPDVGWISLLTPDFMEKTDETKIARDRYWPNRPEFIEDIETAKKLLEYTYAPFGGMDALARTLRAKYAGQNSGGAMATSYIMRREMIIDLGMFDDSYDEAGGIHEDKDYHLRMEQDGRWKTMVIHDSFAHHFSMMTRRGRHWQGEKGDDWELQREKNWRHKHNTRTINAEL